MNPIEMEAAVREINKELPRGYRAEISHDVIDRSLDRNCILIRKAGFADKRIVARVYPDQGFRIVWEDEIEKIDQAIKNQGH